VSLLKDFENKIETTLEGFFARRFKSGVHPVEVAKRLAREMDSNRTIGIGKVYAPTDYVILLSKKDYDRIKPYEAAFVSELSEFLVGHAAKEHYTLLQRPSIRLKSKAGLVLGQLQVESVLAAEPGRPAGGGTEIIAPEVVEEIKRKTRQQAVATLELPAEGQMYRLGTDAVTIGRLAASDIRVGDRNVSRRHAQVLPVEGGYEVVDLDSTNGVLVNEQPVKRHRLQDGDVITLGTTELVFRSPRDV